MQISKFSVFIFSKFSLFLNLELIRITFDLAEFNVNLFAYIQSANNKLHILGMQY